MDDDQDMDAPSISTLPEEKTPPPRRRKAESSKKKPQKIPTPVALSLSWRKSGQSGRASDGEQAEDPEDEEDQLIDDEDDTATPAVISSAKTSEVAPKKKAPAKRKSRKEPGAEDEVKKRQKTSTKSRKLQAPGIEATPSESLSIDDGTDAGTGANTPTISVVESEPQDQISLSKPAKKKSTPRKSAPKAAKHQPSGLKMVIPALSSITVDDTASVMSEGGTAASSPVTGAFEKSQPGSPEPEQHPPSSPTTAAAPLAEETNLENVPLPVYPLPSKPFPVQAPPKITTGFAPPLPLDKSGKKVRHWRVAQREIRGIAGGRWFTRSWAGDRDSEYAASIAAKESEKVNGLPSSHKQPSSTSLSTPSAARGASKKAKGASSLAASAAPSRDASVVPQDTGNNASTSASATTILIATSAVRAPTKMRIQQLPEDPDPHSDAAMDTDPAPTLDNDPAPAPSSEPSARASSFRPEDMS